MVCWSASMTRHSTEPPMDPARSGGTLWSRFAGSSASGGNLRYRDEKVPTLAEVAGLIPEDRALAVELKGREFTDEKALRVLLSVLEETGIGRRTLVISFVERQLAILRQLAPTWRSGTYRFTT